mmetsp:Transcript_45848/g.105754  ORF Transcript_45848/g.105754 Transcript_45848/m.105754 type:complete len:154 (+) Transcript_45848:625-1086(+)
MLLVEMSADARTPADLREGALHIACAAKCTEPQYTELCPEALDELRKHTDKREVVWACCIGCGATHGLKRCDKCGKARFCGMDCMRQTWPTHKRCCKEWAAEEPPGATKDFEDAVDVMTLPSKELKRRLDRRKISYAGVLERTELVALLQSAI